MKIVPFSRTEIYLIEEIQKEDTKGIIPEWTHNIRVDYHPFTGVVQNISLHIDFTNREIDKEYHKKKESFIERRQKAIDVKDSEKYLKICKEEKQFEGNYTQLVQDPSQIEKILKLIEDNKCLEENTTRT